jgi:hypothetical protein
MKRADMSVQCSILSIGRTGLQLMGRTGLATDANVLLVSEAGGQQVLVT